MMEQANTTKECLHYWEYGYVAELMIYCTKCDKEIDDVYDDQTAREIYRNKKPVNGQLVNKPD